jgi:GT2 family glycosyltransferase
MSAVRLDVPVSDEPAYQAWLASRFPSRSDLEHLRKAALGLAAGPVISVVMPVYDPPLSFLREAIDSVRAQLYPCWELCLVNDGSTEPAVKEVLAQAVREEGRIRIVELPQNCGIVAASNAGLEIATGAFVAFLDHDDLLTPDALYEIAALLDRHPMADMIYSDEDKVDPMGRLSGPVFKPDWCPDSFLSRMYTCHLSAYRRSLVDEIGRFREGYDGGQSYDLALRLTERTERIHHIPKVLYHWRVHARSTAADSGEKLYVYEADQRALQAAIDRRGEPGRVVRVPGELGFYVVRYTIRQPQRVSIIIPSRDQGNMLHNCLESIFTRTVYHDYEVVVVDNGSVQTRAKEVLAEWQRREPERFRCVPLAIPFNFSTLCNCGADNARGDLLLFLNNDTEVITPDWVGAMVEQAQRPSIGAVGALLLYGDGTIQHAGAILGLGGLAAHSHRGCPSTSPGYMSQVVTMNNYSSVAGTCLMCRRETFDEVGRFDERLPGDYEDVDLCLKLVEAGYRNVYLPHVRLFHHEAVTRGKDYVEKDPAARASAAGIMRERWSAYIEHDPCYNPNLTRDREDYGLRIETIGVTAPARFEPRLDGFFSCVDSIRVYGRRCLTLHGWAATRRGEPVNRIAVQIDGQPQGDAARGYPREDVRRAHTFVRSDMVGFHFTLKADTPLPPRIAIELTLFDPRGGSESFTIALDTKRRARPSARSRIGSLARSATTSTVQAALDTFHRLRPDFPDFRALGPNRGLVEVLKHLCARSRLGRPLLRLGRRIPALSDRLGLDVPLADDARYVRWLWREYPRRHRIAQLKGAVAELRYRPTISVFTPVFNIDARCLTEAIESVRSQTYPDWQLCIADDASSEPHVRPLLERYARLDPRITVVFREHNGNISAASNSALTLATGEFVAQLDHDDLLTPHALQSVVSLLNEHPEADFIYSDEDKVDLQHIHSQPFFKPDWSPDTFLTKMYTCHFAVYRRSLIEAIGGFRATYDGAEDYDLVLRLVERTDRIFHLPKVLYHWRMHPASTATGSRDVKPWAYASGVRAVQDALDRRGEPGTASRLAGNIGFYEVRYALAARDLVSIVIPTRDLPRLLDRCLLSVFERSSHSNFEVIVVDNGSVEAETRRVLARWREREPGRFTAFRMNEPFNFSRLNNAGVARSKGRYLLFLNNDTEVITPDWIQDMAQQAQRPSIGAVGVQLLYRDNRIQHAGVVMGISGTAGHPHRGVPSNACGYFGRINTVANVSAVTGACMMTRREVFEAVRGFDESFDSAYNDVDLCLRLLRRGLRHIYLPYVQLYHMESQTWRHRYDVRSYEAAAALLRSKWPALMEHDPCYNPNLTRAAEDYSIG